MKTPVLTNLIFQMNTAQYDKVNTLNTTTNPLLNPSF